MTKRQLIASTIISVGIFASIVTTISTKANAITFKETASQDLQRAMPTNGNLLSYYEVIKEPKKSVVNIFTKKVVKQVTTMNPLMNDPFFRQFFGGELGGMQMPKDRVERSLGSGVIVTEDGYIITNNHVIENADEIMVVLPDTKNELHAKLIGADPKTDLAVIKIDAKGLIPISFADSTKVREGDVVFAIGNPFGVGETVTQGIVSALNKSGIGINDYENFIQTDASINPGNSGGALVDSRGGLIGINTAILSNTGQNNGIGFAIPSSLAKKISKELVEKGKIERGRIGITMKDMSEKERKYYSCDKGVIVMDVQKGSPAEKAGIKMGDLVVKINGQNVIDSAFLKNYVGSMSPSTPVALVLLRAGKNVNITLKLEKIDDKVVAVTNADYTFMDGLGLVDINDAMRKKYSLASKQQGALVMNVKENSSASRNGFSEGDVIVQVEDIEVMSVHDAIGAKKALGSLSNKQIFVRRKGAVYSVILE